MSAELEMIADYGCEIGENPLWHAAEQRLYWVDIPTGRLFRYSPVSGQHEQCLSGEAIGGFTIQRDGSLLLFMARGAIKLWQDGHLRTIIREIPDEVRTRFNDVMADPAGRVYCGTMPTEGRPGRLYRLDTNGSLVKLLDGIGTPNGLGLTPDYSGLYFTDSIKRKIYFFKYDQMTGAISNQRMFASVPDGEGLPDGLTVDTSGYVWSARWGGGCIVRYAPNGTEERRIQFPVKNVSSLTFGGLDCRDIYVTTAGGTNKPVEGPLAGGLFRLRLNIQGRPEHLSNLAANLI